MAGRRYFCFCEDNCKFETMSKEQIITAIYEAVTNGEIKDIDAGFITTVKEQNKGKGLVFWLGTTAEYNALIAAEGKDPNCFYIKTDDTALADLGAKITAIEKELATKFTELRKDLETIINEFNAEFNRIDLKATENQEDIERIDNKATENQEKIHNLEDDVKGIFIKDGDSFAHSDVNYYGGIITTSARDIVFFVPISRIIKTKYVYVNNLKASIRGVDGYINATDDTQIPYVNAGGGKVDYYTVSATVLPNGVRIIIHIDDNITTFTNAPNNTPVSVGVKVLDLYFSNYVIEG